MNGLIAAAFVALVGATITLNWTPVTDPKLYAHRIHYSNYSSNLPLPYNFIVNDTSNTYQFTNISTSKKYCYAVSFLFYTSATHTGSIESSPSNKQCGIVTVHPNFGGVPSYRTSGTDNPRPANVAPKVLPDCTPCHGAKY